MRVLLDECVPWPVRHILTGHDCATAHHMGWNAVRNGDLLNLAEAAFDLFVTSDQNLRYQQNLQGRRIAILELSTNNLRRLQAAAALIQESVGRMQPGEYRHLDVP